MATTRVCIVPNDIYVCLRRFSEPGTHLSLQEDEYVMDGMFDLGMDLTRSFLHLHFAIEEETLACISSTALQRGKNRETKQVRR